MSLEQAGDMSKVLALGIMPWLNYLKPLRWHLRPAQFNPVPIFNSIATLCAALVAAYYYYGSPDVADIFYPPFRLLLPLFIGCAIVYFALFLAYRDSVARGKRQWPLVVGFMVYILLFSCFALFAVNLEVRNAYQVVRGQVVDISTDKGVPDAEVVIYNFDTPVRSCSTAADGSFFVAVEKETAIDRIGVEKDGFRSHLKIFAEKPEPSYRISLEPE